MSDFLLELLSEEIPARMQDKACADLARMFTDELAKAGLAATAIDTYATPRRLALIARGLPLAAEAVREETKGPRASAPPQALEGFLRKTGLSRDQLIERDGVLFAVVDKPGRATADVLAAAIPAIVRAFPWPKSMRWGEASSTTSALRWVRPLQGIVALLDDQVVPFEVEGVASGATTRGHRFHHPETVTIADANDYAGKLRTAQVILDPTERRAIIRDRAAALAAEAGLSVVPDEGLVAENAGLTEWPVPLLGRFDPAFLEVPREVIQLTMRTNQKYFALVDGQGALAPAFICTANIEAADGGAAIVAGNGRVLAARLSDARFFWEQDLKVPLERYAEKLSNIVFHEKLGTLADKVDRVAKIASWLALNFAREDLSRFEILISPEVQPVASPSVHRQSAVALSVNAEEAARLSKADLVSAMVGEFPELQGIMGGYYASAQGKPAPVAEAIRDHYKPVGRDDEVPSEITTVAVSLADKMDTVVAFLISDMGPSGSKDPYALRRAALGVISLILSNRIRIPLRMLIEQACWMLGALPLQDLMKEESFYQKLTREIWREYPTFPGREEFARRAQFWRVTNEPRDDQVLGMLDTFKELAEDQSRESGRKIKEVAKFFIERLKVQQKGSGVRHDLIDAVFSLGDEDDIVRLLARVHALQSFITTNDGINLLAGYRRAASIVKIENKRFAERVQSGPLSYTPEPAEAALSAALDTAEPAAAAAVAAEDFEAAMQALARLRPAVDAFFDQVTVNDPDRNKRAARLALLDRIRVAVHNVADFSRIEG